MRTWFLPPRFASSSAVSASASRSGNSVLSSAASATAQDYTATLLDLGRPPVVGLVEPRRELAGLETALDSLSGHIVRK